MGGNEKKILLAHTLISTNTEHALPMNFRCTWESIKENESFRNFVVTVYIVHLIIFIAFFNWVCPSCIYKIPVSHTASMFCVNLALCVGYYCTYLYWIVRNVSLVIATVYMAFITCHVYFIFLFFLVKVLSPRILKKVKTRLIWFMLVNKRPAHFSFEFKETPSQEEHKNIFSSLKVNEMALSDQSDFPAFFCLWMMAHRNFHNSGILQSAFAP